MPSLAKKEIFGLVHVPEITEVGVRDRSYSPSLEPALKLLWHDYYAEGYYNHYLSYHQSPHREPYFRPMASSLQLCPLKDIFDSEAIEKYNNYKLKFQRQRLNEFFVIHKDDEWFRLKYHPEDSVKWKEEQMAALMKIIDVFLDLLNQDKLNLVSVDCPTTNELLKLLDRVVVKLEGGTEENLVVIEHKYAKLEKKQEHKSEEKKVDETFVNKEEGELENDNYKPKNVEEYEGKTK